MGGVMMFCSNCGKKIDDNVKFCPFCGVSVKKNSGMRNPEKPVCKRSINGKIIIMLLFVGLFLIGGIATKLFRGSEKSSGKIENATTEPENSEIILESDSKENDLDEDKSIERDNENGQNDFLYLALVENEEGKHGFINEQGEEVIACQYDNARSFGDNGSELAAVGTENGVDANGDKLYKWGYIDRKGNLVVPMKYDAVALWPDANIPLLAVAKQVGTDSDGKPHLKWGFIDKMGNEMTEYKYDNILTDIDYSLNGLMCLIKYSEDSTFEYCVINAKGEEIIPFGKYNEISVENDGLISVEKQIGVSEDGYPICKWGCIDEKENVIIPFEYNYLLSLSDNGLRPASKRNEAGESKVGFIDKNGNERIPFQFESANSFYYGFAGVGDEQDNLGFINEQGELVIPYQYYRGYGHFDKNKRAIIESWNEQNQDYDVRLINDRGEEILPCQYSEIFLIMSDIYSVKSGEKYGCVDCDGKMILPVQYDLISGGDNGWMLVGKYNEDTDRYTYQYMDEKGNVVLQLSEEYISAFGFV